MSAFFQDATTSNGSAGTFENMENGEANGSKQVPQKEFSMKNFHHKSQASNALLNLALMCLNVGQMKLLLNGKHKHNVIYWSVFGLLVASVFLQIIHFVLSMITAQGDVEKTDDNGKHRYRINKIHGIAVLFAFFICVVNIFVSTFIVNMP